MAASAPCREGRATSCPLAVSGVAIIAIAPRATHTPCALTIRIHGSDSRERRRGRRHRKSKHGPLAVCAYARFEKSTRREIGDSYSSYLSQEHDTNTHAHERPAQRRTRCPSTAVDRNTHTHRELKAAVDRMPRLPRYAPRYAPRVETCEETRNMFTDLVQTSRPMGGSESTSRLRPARIRLWHPLAKALLRSPDQALAHGARSGPDCRLGHGLEYWGQRS